MNIPGFTGEASLYKTSGHYQADRNAIKASIQMSTGVHAAAYAIKKAADGSVYYEDTGTGEVIVIEDTAAPLPPPQPPVWNWEARGSGRPVRGRGGGRGRGRGRGKRPKKQPPPPPPPPKEPPKWRCYEICGDSQADALKSCARNAIKKSELSWMNTDVARDVALETCIEISDRYYERCKVELCGY